MVNEKIVVMGASTGGLKALRTILPALPADLPASIFITVHIGAWPSILPEILQKTCALPVKHAVDGEVIEASSVYVAPSDQHMLLADRKIRLSRGPKENFVRPAIDPLFRSAAVEYGSAVIGVVLTGELDDGAAGLRAIYACGGVTLVQSPDTCDAASMPNAAIRATQVDRIVSLNEMGDAITSAVLQLRSPRSLSMSERRNAEIEAAISLTGRSLPAELDKIGTPSKLTCPDCGGVVWQIGDAKPLRYRCHTGHAFSAMSLDHAQAEGVEDALWAAMRRLNERLLLAQEEVNSAPSAMPAMQAKIADIEGARQALQRLLTPKTTAFDEGPSTASGR